MGSSGLAGQQWANWRMLKKSAGFFARGMRLYDWKAVLMATPNSMASLALKLA